MNLKKTLFLLAALIVSLQPMTAGQVVGFSGNAYVTQNKEGAGISDKGLVGWTSALSVVSVYFYIHQPEELQLSFQASGHASWKVSCGNREFQVRVDGDQIFAVPVGIVKVASAGYVRVDIQGVEKSGSTFGEIKSLVVDGAQGKLSYVTDFSDYWGRRGPSVHMAYQLPQQDTEWFYNEVRVPQKGEIMHSYYMAAGFGEGYFGMQYNSPTERRILFSVWSPFDTQDPKQIPEEDRIKLLRKGDKVHIGEFGNEGSGGQSYLRYNWKAGETYKFLMHIRPDGKGNTAYTAYFFATEENRWLLIASFLRPKTDTWYKGAHSFLENFNPEQGYLTRQVEFGNQWACGVDGVWSRITEGTFTHDATAGAGVRLDFQGGLLPDQKAFYLKMGGFFNESTPLRTKFVRQPEGEMPKIEFDRLNKL